MAVTPPPQVVLREMLTGYWTAQAIHAAAVLGVADLLKDGPRTSADLAAVTGTHERSLYRLLRALVSVGVFAEEAPGHFGLSPLAECLRTDAVNSVRAMAIMTGSEHYHSWGDLLYSIRTGQTAFEHLYGQPIFPYLATHPEAAQVFDDAMTAIHGAETAAMLDAYDFGPFQTLVDVGGGNGSLLTAALQRYPALRGILFDRADVVDRARPLLKAAGLEERCPAVAGSFFSSVPAGGDAYLMRHIIHDWNDVLALSILRNCRQVMPVGGRLLLIESVIPPGPGASWSKFLDLNMLVIPGGMERTEAEYRDLLALAGFRLERIVPTRTEICLIEGLPA